MRDLSRLIGTAIIWSAFAGIMVTILVSSTGPMASATGDTVMVVVGLLTLVAGASTYVVWTGGQEPRGVDYNAPVNKAKRVRPTRMSDLLDTLSADDVYELEDLLLRREEEERLKTLRE